MNKQIKFSGIGRNVPQNSASDGSCQEVINMRYRKGAWRPVPEKEVIHNAPFTYLGSAIHFDGANIYLHDIEGGLNTGLPNWVGYHAGFASLFSIDPCSGICDKIDDCVNAEGLKVVFLKRTMIVTSGAGLLMYLWTKKPDSKGFYGKIGSLPTPDVTLKTSPYYNLALEEELGLNTGSGCAVRSETGHTPEEIMGHYYTIINQQSALKGALYGSILYRVAYRLFDGSYIMHSIPKFLEIANGGWLHQYNPIGDSWDNALWSWVLPIASVNGFLRTKSYPTPLFDTVKDLVSSIDVFATKCTELYKVDNTTLTTDMLQRRDYEGSAQIDVNREFSTLFPINTDQYNTMADAEGWYKIMEFDFAKVVSATYDIVQEADTKHFYQDYATRKTLPTDQNSHHNIIAKNALVFNDYVHLQNIKTLYESPVVQFVRDQFSINGDSTPSPYDLLMDHTETVEQRTGVVVVYLKTGLGDAVLTHEYHVPLYYSDTLTSYFFVQPAIVGYPDARATNMEVAIKVSEGNYQLLWSATLKASVGGNFAYARTVKPNSPNISDGYYYNNWIVESALGNPYTVPKAFSTDFDTNRIQVSAIQNPLVYPAKHSYQVGTGDGIAMAIASEPMSQGNFGQFPLICFTSKGRYTLAQGSGDVLYASIQPLDGEVVDNAKNVIGIDSSVIYSTELGLYMAQGMQKTRISELVEGKPHLTLVNEEEVQSLLTDIRCTPQLNGCLSEVDFLTYLKSSQIGYDQVNKELIVTNSDPAYGYSYVYSTEYQLWYKLSHAYESLIVNYPYIYGVRDEQTYNLSSEVDTGYVPVLFISNAMSIETPDVYKKLERAICRTIFNPKSGTYMGLYLFGTDDLWTYQFLTGRQRTDTSSGTDQIPLKDLMIQRSQGSVRFFNLVINGNVSLDSEVSYVDISVEVKLNQKLR